MIATDATAQTHPLDEGRVPVPAGVRPVYDQVFRVVSMPDGPRPLMLNLYLPPQADPAASPDQRPPLIVWIHGGGWRNGNRNRLHVPWLAGEGYALASIEYRLSHEAIFPAQIHDVKAAVRWLIAHAEDHGYDPRRVIVGGPSAGGYLAALLGAVADKEGVLEEDDPPLGELPIRVAGVINCYGPTDMVAITQWDRQLPPAREAFAGLFGGPPSEHPDLVQAASVTTYLDANTPPFLLIHGEDDPVIDPEQSRRFHERLTELGVDSELHILPGQRHGGPEFFTTDAARQRLLAFVRRAAGQAVDAPATPSAATPRRPQPVILRPGDAQLPEAPEGFTVVRNIIYRVAPGQAPENAGDLELMLDLYLPPRGGESARPPLVVFLHGGGWMEGTRHRMGLRWLMERGYAMASVEYRYSHDAPFPAQLHDVKAAVRWLRDHAADYGYDGDRIAAAGTSAGGTLAALLGTTAGVAELDADGLDPARNDVSTRVAAALTFYGPCDFTWFVEHGFPAPVTQRAVEGLLGGPIEQRLDVARLAGAGTHASTDDAPIFVGHGELDPIVPADISRRFHQQLSDSGVETELVILPEGMHGNPPEVFWHNETFRGRINRFLDAHLQHVGTDAQP